MANIDLKAIHEAIVRDDLRKFKEQVKSNSDLSFCYGRFPILSLCYLYNSCSILEVYEKYMLGLSNYTATDEYLEDYAKFKSVAGKAIRLFSEEMVYPIEMLSVLGDSEIIAKNYKKLYKSGEITEKMQKIYSLTHDEEIEISVSKFVARQKKTSRAKKIFLSAFIIVFCIFLAFPITCISVISSSTGLGTKASPIVIRNEREFVDALSSGKRNYRLTSDIVLSKNVSTEKFSGKIDGNNHELTLSESQKEPLIETLSGTIANLKIEASLLELDIEKSFGVIANSLSGTIYGCEVQLQGEAKFLTDTDTYFSMFVVTNDGLILNSKFEGEVKASNDSNQNAFLVGFAGTNNGEIANCKAQEGSFVTDTVDCAGIAIDNYGKISGCENRLDISQTSEKEWHPNASGITVNNYGKIESVVNRGDISSTSTNETLKNDTNTDGFVVYAAGVACVSVNDITGAKNYGNISASSIHSTIYIGGIVGFSSFDSEKETEGTINRSKSFGNISAKIADANFGEENLSLIVYAGGICGLGYCGLNLCGFEGNISIQSDGEKFAGGLIGMAYAMFKENKLLIPITNCYTSTVFNFDKNNGGLVGCINIGSQEYLSLIFGNCHYVRDASMAYSVNFRIMYSVQGQTIFSEIFQIEDGGAISSYDSLENLKKNAGGLNFDE